ncbi:antibiotic biosynthesis monooxygenase [Streptomyces sp. NBC_01260]|uniref:putative quinol monooxygenase n=1 Tax=unclassified Streptomyces TaxID=2593676 RepID=UPI000F473351|nr:MULTISPECIES: antibiotic biosynthesis monooxygenase family protein [unclassified Streptomyces]MCX4768884.1 antibiotic biosynthesis monooxygenase [Streptomyces sp. NBC_01285]ROQ76956.1 quinol monooxygenase YgiN [Streptomyces sp. CEV 2-1]RPK40855.1 Antibiotic biosynthesis monooxygenase [Streptomyces sp. ADI92-24]
MTYVVVARYRTRPGEQDTVLPLLDSMAAASRREPGNLGYRVHQGIEDPRAIVLYEEYATEADFTAHCATPHFQEIVLGKVVPLLESRDVLRCAPRDEVGA